MGACKSRRHPAQLSEVFRKTEHKRKTMNDLQIIAINWRDHIAPNTTLSDAVRYCLLTVESDKWRNDEQHEQQSWNVDVVLHFCFEEHGDDALLLELENQTDCAGWAHWLLHDRIQLQSLLIDIVTTSDNQNEVMH